MAILKRPRGLPGLLAAALLAAAAGHAEIAAEYDVKAVFLYNFTKFVEWPPAAFADGRHSLKLCVLGEDPFGRSLQEVASEEVAGRKLTVLRAPRLSDPAGCQVLFISRSERRRLPALLAALRDEPVLTVADTPGFLEQGGIINFVLAGSKVRFEINQEAAERAGLTISSKLMRLALRVKPGTAEP